jgi:hypothetical protein
MTILFGIFASVIVGAAGAFVFIVSTDGRTGSQASNRNRISD